MQRQQRRVSSVSKGEPLPWDHDMAVRPEGLGLGSAVLATHPLRKRTRIKGQCRSTHSRVPELERVSALSRHVDGQVVHLIDGRRVLVSQCDGEACSEVRRCGTATRGAACRTEGRAGPTAP